jgi:hypothetical protein
MLHIKRAENLLDLMDQDAQTHREISEIRIFSEARLTHYPQKDADSFLSKCSTLREQELADLMAQDAQTHRFSAPLTMEYRKY